MSKLFYFLYEYELWGETVPKRYHCALWFPSIREAKRFIGLQLRANKYSRPRSRRVIEVREVTSRG